MTRPGGWYRRYARRVEDGRLPRAAAEREAYARTIGEDGFALLDQLDQPETARSLRRLPAVEVLRQVWARHFERKDAAPPGGGVQLRPKEEPPPATEAIESPYDPEARFRTRSGTSWTGYIVHLSETCEDDAVHLMTHAMTTLATVHEARCTAAIHERWPARAWRRGSTWWMPPTSMPSSWCAAARTAASTCSARRASNPTWQAKVEGGLHDRPLRGRLGAAAGALPAREAVLGLEPSGRPRRHALRLGLVPPSRLRRLPGAAPCTRAEHQARHLKLQPRAEYEALKAARGGSRRRRGGAATPGGPGSRAPSRKACAPSGCAAAATAGWPKPTCSTWRPQPRSTSTARGLVQGYPARRHPYLALRRLATA